MITADHGDFAAKAYEKKRHAVTIEVEGAVEILDMWLQSDTCNPKAKGWDNAARPRAWVNYHRHVFRATGDTAELRISDWGLGPRAEVELMFYFIEVQPYLED